MKNKMKMKMKMKNKMKIKMHRLDRMSDLKSFETIAKTAK